jgi:hypothetical protein
VVMTFVALVVYPFVPAFAEKVGLLDQRFALGPHLRRLVGKNANHRARFPEILAQGLAVATRQGRRMMLRGHRTSKRKGWQP